MKKFFDPFLLKGSTSVLHDNESRDDVGHCADPGCYSRLINYNATIKQMKALAELSSECHQSIKVTFFFKFKILDLINILNYSSMSVTCRRLNTADKCSPGGTTETETRNISGPEITQTEFTPVSAESTAIV